MLVKKTQRKVVDVGALRGALRSRVFLVSGLCAAAFVLVIIATNLASIYYGMHLYQTGQSLTIKRWVLGLAHDKLSFIPNFVSGLGARPEHLDIDVSFKNYQKLAAKRQEALDVGQLFSSAEDWVPAKIRYEGETYRVELRLKGDWNDHWRRRDQWSYKVKVKDGKTLFGMNRFALQDPLTRTYLNEWYFHKLLDFSGLISLRYDFIDVTINGKHQSIYAIEENFDKRLIENNDHREGPIIRFANRYRWWNNRGLLPIFLGASLAPYQEGKIMKDENLSAQFNAARVLMELFRRERLPASQVFDATKFARFLAIYDLLGFGKTPNLDDMKFYYNPITSLLEPIGYDLNKPFQPLARIKSLIGAGRHLKIDSSAGLRRGKYHDMLFEDRHFFEAYINALEEISKKEFLDDFFELTDSEYREKLQILHKSYPWYNFKDKPVLYANQEYIRKVLSPPKSLQIYYQGFSPVNRLLSLQVRNIDSLPVEILNVMYGDSVIFSPAKETILQAAVVSEPIQHSLMEFRPSPEFTLSDVEIDQFKVTYKILGKSTASHESVFPWPEVDENFLQKDLMREPSNFRDFEFLEIDEQKKIVELLPGQWQLTRNLIIGQGYRVLAGPGVELNLSDSAKILTYSQVEFVGTEEEPILISSTDSSGGGLVVMNAEQESVLKFVIFDNLANPSQNGWEVTGAVTFYESPVRIINSQFRKNRSEDALNIIRTTFHINSTSFADTMSDAFDGDFVKGQIANSSFVNSGNDAIDVSGSVLDLNGVIVNGAGDKGLSAGEGSTVTAERIKIENSELAVTSKDMSKISMDRVDLRNSRVGFILFQKKPEFGPASIIAENVNMEGISVPYLLEQGSELTMDEVAMKSSQKNIKDILYGVQYGKSSQSL